MFISIEKAMSLTGKSKNALYRMMAQDRLNFVRCTKGKRFIEVAELRRVYGELHSEPTEPTVTGPQSVNVNNDELVALIGQMRGELNALSEKVDRQTDLIESLTSNGPVVAAPAVSQPTLAAPVAVIADSPEKDPDWPPFITCYADLAKRDEIKARYEKS